MKTEVIKTPSEIADVYAQDKKKDYNKYNDLLIKYVVWNFEFTELQAKTIVGFVTAKFHSCYIDVILNVDSFAQMVKSTITCEPHSNRPHWF